MKVILSEGQIFLDGDEMFSAGRASQTMLLRVKGVSLTCLKT